MDTNTKRATPTAVQLACATLIAGALAGCGGGGGEAAPPPSTPTLVITSTNSDMVGHATAVAALGIPISWLSETSIPLVGGAAAGARPAGMSASLHALRTRLAAAAGDRSHPLDAMTETVTCNYGGTITLTLNDVDNNYVESQGDIETIELSNCRFSQTETYNGSIRLDVGQVTGDSEAYDVTLTQLSYSTPNHALTFDGTYVAYHSSAVVSVDSTTLTAKTPITVNVRTHLPYSDTVTLGVGFVVLDQIDYAAQRNVLSATGQMLSASAGGTVNVSTPSMLMTSRNGAPGYPESGALKVQGKVGSLTVNALSSVSVRLDADTNDDGAIEATNSQSWDWLF